VRLPPQEGRSRAHGWTARALVAVYEATGERRWFDAAARMVRAIVDGQDRTAGTISPVHIPANAKHQSHTPFMAAAVGMALGRYYRHHPEDEDVRDAILGIADWLCYDVANEAGGFSYHWSETDPGTRTTSGNRCLGTMSWAYMATGRRNYLDAAETHASIWKPARWYLSGFGQEYLLNRSGARADATPPAAVQDLTAEAIGGGKVRLTWTAPGGDGNQGAATAYQVKYADKEIKERSDWRRQADKAVSFWAATNCQGDPKPSATGAKESFVVEGLKGGTLWFAIKSYDGQPNQSGLSNVVRVEVN
jgi:hypothetical protein